MSETNTTTTSTPKDATLSEGLKLAIHPEETNLLEQAALQIIQHFVRPGRAFAPEDITTAFQYAEAFVAAINQRRKATGRPPAHDPRFSVGQVGQQE